MTGLDVLKRVRRDLLEIGWVQLHYGHPATGMCLSGWVMHESGMNCYAPQPTCVTADVWLAAVTALRAASPGELMLSKFNDQIGRSLAEVVALVDRAIAYLEPGVEDATPVREAVCA